MRLRPIKDFRDFWGRSGLPEGERLHASIAWSSAVNTFAEHLAKELGVPMEKLQTIAEKVKGGTTLEPVGPATDRMIDIPAVSRAELLARSKTSKGK